MAADPLSSSSTGCSALDWDATLGYRNYLWSLGLGVAEAMDTAQRGMGLDWPTAKELISRSCAEAKAVGGDIVCGANTDQLEPRQVHSLADIESAYVQQCAHIETCGGSVVIMASRALAAAAAGPADYARVYGRVLEGLEGKAILHWLGGMFDPELKSYWGSTDLDRATDALLEIVVAHREKVDGVKVSLLDSSREVALRKRLPAGVRVYSGDDFHFPRLIRGDGETHSDALLGIFDAIAPVASAALAALDRGDAAVFELLLAPTVPLSRHVFGEPTWAYKVGIVFLAYLNGHQDHLRMVGGLESARSLLHLVETFRLADRAGALADPERAAHRLKLLLRLHGVANAS